LQGIGRIHLCLVTCCSTDLLLMTVMLKLCAVLLFEFLIADPLMFPVFWCMSSCRLDYKCHLSGAADPNI
jgi:Flp pilus assembly protein protease CpaA